MPISPATLLGLGQSALPILSPILSKMKLKWKEVALIALVATVIYQNMLDKRFFLPETIPHLESIIEERDQAIEIATTANQELQKDIADINEQVQQWREVSDRLTNDNQLLLSNIENLQEITRSQVKSILNAPTPQSCEAAINYLRDVLPSLHFTIGG